ncbi:hypothetical protein MKW92_039333 [Papaver armeniacum]|nr:hypothetical protein MKW92_039333 [Papaver armeniacum]
MVIEAVKRSCGQLVELCIIDVNCFIWNGDIDYRVEDIADKFGSLRCLRLKSCDVVSGEALMAMVEKSVMLEELEICHCYMVSMGILETIGKTCPRLKSFRLTYDSSTCSYRWGDPTPLLDDYDAKAIAKTMPQLRHLLLSMFELTNHGLKAILDGCLHLQSLDLSQCKLDLEGEDLLNSLKERLVELTLPDASIIDPSTSDRSSDEDTSESSSYFSDGDEDSSESSSYSTDGDE